MNIKRRLHASVIQLCRCLLRDAATEFGRSSLNLASVSCWLSIRQDIFLLPLYTKPSKEVPFTPTHASSLSSRVMTKLHVPSCYDPRLLRTHFGLR